MTNDFCPALRYILTWNNRLVFVNYATQKRNVIILNAPTNKLTKAIKKACLCKILELSNYNLENGLNIRLVS